METLSYFFRYVGPTIFAFITVIVLAAFNHFVGPIVWSGRIVERIEVFSYSVLIAGPIAFVISFLLFFFGFELLRESWPFAKTLFIIASLLAVVGIVVDVLCLPKMK